MKFFTIGFPVILLAVVAGALDKGDAIPVGVATVNTTPKVPIRMAGYASRKAPSEGVGLPLHAKALAFGAGTKDEALSVLIMTEVGGIPVWMRNEVAKRLKEKAKIAPEQLAITSTHTHSSPLVFGKSPYLLSGMSEQEKVVVRNYADFLVDQMEKVALAAISARKPRYLEWGKGEVDFAANRRVIKNGKWVGFGVQRDGPVDHSMPMLKVTELSGDVVAVLANYACHCTTLGSKYNLIHGDWAGVAQEEIENRHPGVTAMITIGCGADQGPQPSGSMEATRKNGRSIADEVDRLLTEDLFPLTSAPAGSYEVVELSLEKLPDIDTWRSLAAKKGRAQALAKDILVKLEHGEEIAGVVSYPIQTWTFDDDLAMVFLGGEVAVDYAHRLYGELDGSRLWLTAYSNDVRAYIPSRRLLREGGYEVDGSRFSSGIPSRFRADTEDRLCHEVLRQLSPPFLPR